MITAHPLCWPDGWSRTPETRRTAAGFKVTFAEARDDLLRQLILMSAKSRIISSNVALKGDGLPYANQVSPEDPGVAVWFTWRGEQRCIPCDRWLTARDNLRAIGKTVEALRGIERWGTGEMLRRSVQSFTALPAPPAPEANCWRVLEICPGATVEAIKAAFRVKARKVHSEMSLNDPIRDAELRELVAAKIEALEAVGR